MSSSLHRLQSGVCHWDLEGLLVAENPAPHPYNRRKSFVVLLAGIISR